jgi:hypothetical protein
MAERMELPGFVGGSYPERATALDSERAINLYPVRAPQEAKSQMALVGTPGLKFLLNLSPNPIRGIQRTTNYWYIVSGNSVWQLDKSLTLTKATGNLNTNGGIVGMSWNNNNQVGIVDGQNLYICTVGTPTPAVTTITTFADSPFGQIPKPTSICFLNQYFIISAADSQEFLWSNLNDGTLWNTLDHDFATNSPNNLVAVASANGYLYLLCTDITEVWSNNPTQTTIGSTVIGFPFNYTGTIIPFGLAGPNTVANINNGLAWLTSTNLTSPHVIFTQGAQEILISTPALEQLISNYSDFSNAFCLVSHQTGSETIIISFPSSSATHCYDFQSKMWHERSSYNGQVWLPSAIEAFGTNVEIAGDSTTGNIYYLDPNTYTENGQPLVRTRITPPYASKDTLDSCYELIVEFEPGVGNANPPGDDPVATIECSVDHGKTFDYPRKEHLGKQGEYYQRVQWYRFGQGRSFVFKLTIASPVKVVIIKAWSDLELGEH